MTDAAHSSIGRAGLLRADGLDYAAADVIADGLRLLADGQGADRIGFRGIRSLSTAQGDPILDGRGEQRRAILAGVFSRDQIPAAAAQIADLNARAWNDPRDSLGLGGAVGGWHCYAHVQRVSAPITNRLVAGNLGTVCAPGIGAFVTLVADIDPEPGACSSVPLEVAHDLSDVLVDIGVPRPAIMLMQSGRGGYLLVAIEPQPLSARETMKLATQTIARVIEAAELPAHGDKAVFDAPRILRVAGTTNHKRDADPTTPAWILEPWTPGVRCPWSVVERLAAKSRPKLRAVPSRLGSVDSAGSTRRPLRALFTDRGWLYRERADGVCDVKCPNAAQHTDGRDGAILYPPREPGGPGWLKCSHAHCTDLTLFDVYRLLERRA